MICNVATKFKEKIKARNHIKNINQYKEEKKYHFRKKLILFLCSNILIPFKVEY